MDLTWEEIQQSARRNHTGYRTVKKLLGSKEYNR
jgi:hypothetical protein